MINTIDWTTIVSFLSPSVSILSAIYAADTAYKARMIFIHPHRVSFYEKFICFNRKIMYSDICVQDILDFYIVLDNADFYFSNEVIKKLDEYRKN